MTKTARSTLFILFPYSPGCKGMKSVEKIACSFDSAPEINF
jgi:hypothetical protein